MLKLLAVASWAIPLTSVRLHGLLISAKIGPISVVFWEHITHAPIQEKKPVI